MATKQSSRSRRSSSSRSRGPRHVEAVLDPTWQNPYAPSAAERQTHLDVARRFAIKRSLPVGYVVGGVAVVSLVAIAISWWFLLLALLLGVAAVLAVRRALARFEDRANNLGAKVLSGFTIAGTSRDHQRLMTVLDRLTATFGVDQVSAFVIDDAGYNAALVPNGQSYAFLVTSALMRDFELIELEGVVAHCMARQRLGVLTRESASAVVNAAPSVRRDVAGSGLTYRADEVAAAAIRYPLGLAGALRRCARQVLPPSSYFASTQYDRSRFIWFDVCGDRSTPDLADLDDVELRALALEEW
ncbi:MAG: hypothetical protein HIU57_00630 [Acidobacteria bacterium]|nr:hypothetical protein [Acidobacteriota bacterium]